MKAHIPRLLWLDDELDSDRATYVLVWRRWLQQANDRGLCRLTMCNCIEKLAAHLQTGDPEFDLLMFDVMLKRERSPSFGPIGFAEEQVRRLEAGMQIVGLMRNKSFADERPVWLSRYSRKPVVLLSSTPGLQNMIGTHVDGNRRDDLHCLVKSLNTDTPGVTRPDANFERSFESILKQLLPSAPSLT